MGKRFKQASKNIRRRVGAALAANVGDALLRALYATCRWEYVDYHYMREFFDQGRPVFGATWHYCLLSVVMHYRYMKPAVMISASADARVLARTLTSWGYTPFFGSRLKGGNDAAKDLIQEVKAGRPLSGLVADGAQGPARRAQTGAAFIARAAKAPLVPTIVAAKRRITLKSWDRFEIPLPFTTLTVFAGPPIYALPKKSGQTLEEARRMLEEGLNALVEKAESRYGRRPPPAIAPDGRQSR